jgi:hypothetical protein
LAQGTELARDAAQRAGKARGGTVDAGEGDVGIQQRRADSGGKADDEAEIFSQ